MIYFGIGLAVGLPLFIWWRWTSVARGARQRDERLFKLLNPLVERLAGGQAVSAEDVRTFTDCPATWHMLHAALREHGREELFPPELLNEESQAKAELAYWMTHPNELADPPSEIELIETLIRPIDGRDARFLVFRYRMPAGNWAHADGWLLGLSGPFYGDEKPFVDMAGAFSRAGDREGSATPDELVDWYLGMLRQKRIVPADPAPRAG